MTDTTCWLRVLPICLVACNTAPVLPPGDDRVIELVEAELWSGGELRAVVRHAETEEGPVSITLDGEALVVTRVDDTTFAATLPVRTGELLVRMEREDLDPLETTATLHGFVSGGLGPAVGGAVVAREVAGGHVALGSTFEGAAEVSLANAQVLRTWPLTTHDVRCSGGIAPGPVPGQVIVRSGNGGTAIDNCEYYRARPYDATGLGASVDGAIGAAGYGLSAIVGPLTVILASQNQGAEFGRCAVAGEPWSECHTLTVNNYGNLVGYEAGYAARRIIPLARLTALHDLETGDIVAQMPDDDGGTYYTSAAFSASEDSVYLTANGNSGVYSGTTGKIFAVNAATGAVLDIVEVPDGLPLAIAVDDVGDWILTVINNRVEDRAWLRVYSRSDHAVVADLPIDDAAIVSAIGDHYHFRLVLDRVRSQVTLVSTARIRYFQNTPIPPMAIARWSLP